METEIELQAEKQLEDYLFKEMNLGWCPISGSPVIAGYRQIEITGYGVIDLISVAPAIFDEGDSSCIKPKTIRIYELKKGDLDLNAIAQICRYKTAIERFLNTTSDAYVDAIFEYYLVGNRLAQGDVCYLSDNIDWLNIYTFSVTLESGIYFKDVIGGWRSTSEDFSRITKFASKEFNPEPQIVSSRKNDKVVALPVKSEGGA